MSLKRTETPAMEEIDRFDEGVGWLAYPDEKIQRASHAITVDDEIWVIDPVDAAEVDDLLAELEGEVAGVVVGFGHHTRDAATVATRHDVAVHIPDWMTGVDSDIDAPVRRFGRELTAGLQTITVRNSTVPPWQEVALYQPESGTLIVPEAVGTAPHFLGDRERLGVHPLLRWTPPRDAFDGVDPERILSGHGAGVHEDAGRALRSALRNARVKLPSAYANALGEWLD